MRNDVEKLMDMAHESELLKLQRKKIKWEMVEQRQKAHSHYFINNKRKVRVCDFLIMLAIIFNIGALILTNIAVARINPDHEYRELNPVAAYVGNFEYVYQEEFVDEKGVWSVNPFLESFRGEYGTLVFQVMVYALVVGHYCWVRTRTYSHATFVVLLSFSATACFFLGWDFFNDLGLVVGKWLGGGF